MDRLSGLFAMLGTMAVLVAAPRGAQAQEVEVVTPEVVATYPHDVRAFTQGLLLHEGTFFESTGLRGRSSLREVNIQTGEVIRSKSLETQYFAEGLTLLGGRLIQLTWQRQTAIVYDQKTFEEIKRFSYQGEGWGLCSQKTADGERLVMSNGSGTLAFRNPDSFTLQSEVAVTLNGARTTRLNELECVGSLVYANVWQSSNVLRIDPSSGKVLTRIDASALTRAHLRADVLNGIAYDPRSQHFFLTGKLWDKVYEVRFDFDPSAPGQTESSAGPTAGRPAATLSARSPSATNVAAPEALPPNTAAPNPPVSSSNPSPPGSLLPSPESSVARKSSTPAAPRAELTDVEAPASGLCNCSAVGRALTGSWWSAAALLGLGLFIRRAWPRAR